MSTIPAPCQQGKSRQDGVSCCDGRNSRRTPVRTRCYLIRQFDVVTCGAVSPFLLRIQRFLKEPEKEMEK